MNTEPTAEMQAIIQQMQEDASGQPDWLMLPAPEGRALSLENNRRWNVDLPPMEVEETTLDGLPARILTPSNDEGTGAILDVHGGGFAFCSQLTHERSARMLALAAAAPVVTFDYRLAPEDPFPAGLEDTRRAWHAFAAHYPDRFRAIAGDSAGANLSMAAMLAGLDPMPDCALLFYGVFDADFQSPSYRLFADAPLLTRAKMIRYFDWYVPDEGRSDPRVSPLQASDEALKNLPPIYLNAAGIDPLRSDAERMAERLKSLGRNDVFDLYEGVIHGFMQMTAFLADARKAHEDAGAAFRNFSRKT